MDSEAATTVLKSVDLPLRHPSLTAAQLRKRCAPETLSFDTTAELEDLRHPLGQKRAVEAAHFALAMERPGYNLFVMGPSGAGKHALVRELLDREASGRHAPSDWVYVHDFDRPDDPRALRLPPGLARAFARDMDKLVEDLRVAIPAAFEGPQYASRIEELERDLEQRHDSLFEAVEKIGREREIAVARSPTGVMFAPLRDGEVMSAEAFEALPDEEKAGIRAGIQELQLELRDRLKSIPAMQKAAREKVRELDQEVTCFTVDQTLDELRLRYAAEGDVVAYLDAVARDIVTHVREFRKKDDGDGALGALRELRPFAKYSVNVLVDHAESKGAPVVYEDHSSHEHLVGRVEHHAALGSLVTDFTLIKAGALHRANGGFLVLDARKLLTQPYAWDSLKRSLFSERIQIEPLPQLLGLSSTHSLKPESIPLSIKVVLIGSRTVYYQLSELDPEFLELFKVQADFEDTVPRTSESEHELCQMVATVARRDDLRPISRRAMARIVEEAARLSHAADELSTHSRSILDLVAQSEYFAERRSAETVALEDVQTALETQIARRDRIRSRLTDSVAKGTVLLSVAGTSVGQVNGLAAIALGDFVFGRATRITATARVGEGRVMDIEREVELGGPLHSKGVLIVSNYVASRYATNYPLSLSASLVFEQSYSGVEGDSASLAELCALLSALAGVPVSQAIALTGSVNQLGEVQAIGAVNEKIEGFFDTCKAMGLTGAQGVIIPRANVQHLMLREDVVEAARRGEFAVHAVETVDDAMEILTGYTAGKPDETGESPPDSLNGVVEQRLIEFAVLARRFGELAHVATEKDDATEPKLVQLAHRGEGSKTHRP
jgi:lon-related putative ATP-dependent protease